MRRDSDELGERAAGDGGRVAHRLMPPRAPQPAHASVQHGGEGAEEHGPRVRAPDVGDQTGIVDE